jgi:hypothetical protein
MRRIVAMVFVALSPLAVAQAKPRQATLAQQKMCADQAQKKFSESYVGWTEHTSHYNPRANVCYMWLSKTTIGEYGTFDDVVIDAFENSTYAHAFQQTPSEKLSECWVTAPDDSKVQCHSLAEFSQLVKKYFGIKPR